VAECKLCPAAFLARGSAHRAGIVVRDVVAIGEGGEVAVGFVADVEGQLAAHVLTIAAMKSVDTLLSVREFVRVSHVAATARPRAGGVVGQVEITVLACLGVARNLACENHPLRGIARTPVRELRCSALVVVGLAENMATDRVITCLIVVARMVPDTIDSGGRLVHLAGAL